MGGETGGVREAERDVEDREKKKGWMDGRVDGWMDGWADGWMEPKKDCICIGHDGEQGVTHKEGV